MHGACRLLPCDIDNSKILLTISRSLEICLPLFALVLASNSCHVCYTCFLHGSNIFELTAFNGAVKIAAR